MNDRNAGTPSRSSDYNLLNARVDIPFHRHDDYSYTLVAPKQLSFKDGVRFITILKESTIINE